MKLNSSPLLEDQYLECMELIPSYLLGMLLVLKNIVLSDK